LSEIITVGLDLAKNVFQVHCANGSGRGVLRRKLKRELVLDFLGRLAGPRVPGSTMARLPPSPPRSHDRGSKATRSPERGGAGNLNSRGKTPNRSRADPCSFDDVG